MGGFVLDEDENDAIASECSPDADVDADAFAPSYLWVKPCAKGQRQRGIDGE
jgi:hypothetical protein